MNQNSTLNKAKGTGTGTGDKGNTMQCAPSGAEVLSPNESALARAYFKTALCAALANAPDATRRGAWSRSVSPALALVEWGENVGIVPRGGAERMITHLSTRAAIENDERAEVATVTNEELRRIRAGRDAADNGDGSAVGTDEARAQRAHAFARAIAPTMGPVRSYISNRAEREGRGDVQWLLTVARRAESQARKWVRGSQTRTAASKPEIGPAAAADDVGAFMRIQTEAEAIFRTESLTVASNYLRDLRGAGVRVNRSARKHLLPFVARHGGARGRAEAEAWEYGAIRARDGREVGGGWALQGAIHGLADFWLEAPGGADPDADRQDVPESLADLGEVRELGPIKSRPDGGEGSGIRPSTLAVLDSWADDVRDAFAARVAAAATGRAAANSRAAALEGSALIDGLCTYAHGGKGPDRDALAVFFDSRGNLSSTGRSKLHRIRARAGINVSGGPAPAVLSHHSINAPGHSDAH